MFSPGEGGEGGGGVLLYREAPLQSSTPYPFIYHLAEKVPLSYTFY